MDKYIKALPTNTDMNAMTFSLPLPSMCPLCSVAYGEDPKQSYYTFKKIPGAHTLLSVYSLYFCPHCEQLFLVRYRITDEIYDRNPSGYIEQMYPSPSCTSMYSDRIQSVSPRFVEIYRQSEQAESIGLLEICGMGYRKALEFLVKDYSIYFNPDKENQIKTTLLSQCINDFIDNKRIQTLSKASAWVGNDETHYTRKHEDYNLQHLKLFISAVISYVDSELTYLMAEDLISAPKK